MASLTTLVHPVTPPPQFDSIFVSLPPLLRLVYKEMHRELEYLVESVKYETQSWDKEQKQVAANDLLLEMRKLCVDPKLLKFGINPSSFNAFFETIHDVAPNFEIEQSLSNVHPKFCAKCGNEDDVLATSCFHFLCIGCISYLWMWNGGCTKKLSCHVCKNDIEAEDIWSPYDTRSKIDTMVTLLKKEDPNHKVIVFCEFVETLVRLEFALNSSNIKGCCPFDNVNGTINTHLIHQFQNRDDINILLFDLRLMNDLEGFDLSCVSKVYFMNACLNTTEQKVVSLVANQKNQVKFVRVLTKCTIEGRLIKDEKTDSDGIGFGISVQNIDL